MVLEPLAETVLEIRRLHRAQLRCRVHTLDGLLLQPHQRGQGVRIESGRDSGQGVAHVGQPVPQRRGRPDRRGRRVVQLMGETRREGAERKEALSLLKCLLRALGAEEQTFKEVERHRKPIPHQLCELFGPQHEEPRPARSHAASCCTPAGSGHRGTPETLRRRRHGHRSG